MNKNFQALFGLGAVALGIAGAVFGVSQVANNAPLPITGGPVVVTGEHFHTAAGLARPFAGALAGNRLAESSHWVHAGEVVGAGVTELPEGVTARAVLQSLVAQHNDVAAALPASWR